MEQESKNFLVDLIYLIQEKYNQTINCDETEKDEKLFRQGSNYAYYDVLNIIESQLKLFGYNFDEFQPITPHIGKKFER